MPKRAYPEVIDARCLYTSREVRKRLGLGDNAFREMRKKLPATIVGRSALLLGSDVIAYCEQMKKNPTRRTSHEADDGTGARQDAPGLSV